MNITISLIYGFMVGFEFVDDVSEYHIVFDLGFVRILFSKEQ